jgi:hypothetical protein
MCDYSIDSYNASFSIIDALKDIIKVEELNGGKLNDAFNALKV